MSHETDRTGRADVPATSTASVVSVVIVDDSPTARAAMRAALDREPGVVVVGEAENGDQALRIVDRLRPSVVTMDVYLRRQNGLDVARAIMMRSPRPILVVTAADPSDPGLIYRAMEAGALDVVAKLPGASTPGYEEERRALARRLTALARVPVVRRRPRKPPSVAPRARPSPPPDQAVRSDAQFDVVVMGASTGGPPVVDATLRALPAPFSVPLVIVQHMAPGFLEGFAEWLAQGTGHDVALVSAATSLRAGGVYVASDCTHLRLAPNRVLLPSREPPRRHYRPSIDVLFESVARTAGPKALGVLLTGMGDDGVQGLQTLRASGALTAAQDPDTCAVDSMPRRAMAAGGVAVTLKPEEIGQFIAMRGHRCR